jgi:HPt (histidine-containing phosphotransfer) domain-containing protein
MQLRAIMDGDAALEAEMLAGFRTASVKEAAALRDALAKGDCTAIRHASHRMKGLARLVAASSLASVCERLERQAKAGPWPTPPSCWPNSNANGTGSATFERGTPT